MTKSITDIELSLTLSESIAEDYLTALEFMQSNPDYSLMKFRELASSIVDTLAHQQQVRFESNVLAEKIRSLHQAQIISHPMKDTLHSVRKLGNMGVHKMASPGEDAEFYTQRKNTLRDHAEKARRLLVSLFEDLYLMSEKSGKRLRVEYSSIASQEYREILYNAALSTRYRDKLKAGLVIESVRNEQTFSAPAAVSGEFFFHSTSLLRIAADFYQAAYRISANIDSAAIEEETAESFRSEEEWLRAHCDPEPLYRYAVAMLSGDLDDRAEIEGTECLTVAANRGYTAAQAMLGAMLYEEGQFEQAADYLHLAAEKDEALALRFLYHYHADGAACVPDTEKAHAFLKRAVEMDCPDAIATLGEAFDKGIGVPADSEKAEELLKESVQRGSFFGKQYLSYEAAELEEKMKKLQAVQDALLTLQTQVSPGTTAPHRKVGPNDPCPCGSGLKYKKCCRDK